MTSVFLCHDLTCAAVFQTAVKWWRSAVSAGCSGQRCPEHQSCICPHHQTCWGQNLEDHSFLKQRHKDATYCSWSAKWNINTHQGYKTPWSQTVRNLWWWTTDWSYLCCTHLSWEEHVSLQMHITMSSEIQTDQSFYRARSQPTSTEQLDEQFHLPRWNKIAKQKERQSVLLFKKINVAENVTAFCISLVFTKYLSVWSELMEGKCSSITKSSNFLRRTLTWCYSGQNKSQREKKFPLRSIMFRQAPRRKLKFPDKVDVFSLDFSDQVLQLKKTSNSKAGKLE